MFALWKRRLASKIRLSTPYYLLHKNVERFLGAFDEYKKGKAAA